MVRMLACKLEVCHSGWEQGFLQSHNNIFVEIQKTLTTEEVIKKEFHSLSESSFLQNIFLFNITADPYERNDLSKVCLQRLSTIMILNCFICSIISL